MALTTYTTYDEVRAALGVSKTELPDTVLSLTQWDTLTVIGLEDVHTGIPTLYGTISALPTISRSTTEQRFYDLTRLYACYELAQTLLVSLPLFAVRRLTDGRAEFDRQPDVYEDVREGVRGMHNMLKVKLSATYVALAPGETAYSTLAFSRTLSVGLGIDPVTNA
jgi:hypothetical protein